MLRFSARALPSWSVVHVSWPVHVLGRRGVAACGGNLVIYGRISPYVARLWARPGDPAALLSPTMTSAKSKLVPTFVPAPSSTSGEAPAETRRSGGLSLPPGPRAPSPKKRQSTSAHPARRRERLLPARLPDTEDNPQTTPRQRHPLHTAMHESPIPDDPGKKKWLLPCPS